MADSKIDPFDVAALEKSLNDSATRVSTIWLSFLIFSLYLLTAAATVTHRQLLLAEPVKLPVLNIDLPLWGFFFLAPILFVIFHAYVLIQVILLARTASAYNEAVDQNIKVDADNARVRQRLANTLFAQIFAGSPRERTGWLGSLLKAMAWITLAIAPVLILLVFQFMFLPYHSHLATWSHRLLILIELAAVFWLWPLVLDTLREFQKPKLWHPLPWVALLFAVVSLSVATFPSEPHVNLATGHAWRSVQCDRWFAQKFDRLYLPQVDVVDDEKLAKIEKATSDRKLAPHAGERTRTFRARDLACADLSNADLRHVDLTDARLSGARLYQTVLQGASLVRAELQGASLHFAQLQGASLLAAQLQNASLLGALLQDASLSNAQLQGASLDLAELQGVSLDYAELQGASLHLAQLQGASLTGTQLQGASLFGAELQGASLNQAQLQGASLFGADLQGASLQEAQLQGADLNKSAMKFADLSGAQVWRAKNAACRDARVNGYQAGAIIGIKRFAMPIGEPVPATPEAIAKFIERSVAGISDTIGKEEASKRMRAGLVVDPAKDDTAEIAKAWGDCEEAAKMKSPGAFDIEFAVFLRDFVCKARGNRRAIANSIVRKWISQDENRRIFSTQLARGLLGQDGKECAATQDMDEPTKERLRAGINAAPASPPAPSAAPPK